MDYVFEGKWSDDLRTRVQSWIDQKWATWSEENPQQDLTDFIEKSLTKAKTMAEFSTDVLALTLDKTRAEKLAGELSELLRNHQATTVAATAVAHAPEAVTTAQTVSEQSMKTPDMDRTLERTKPASHWDDHLMEQHQGQVDVNSSRMPSRDVRDGRYHQRQFDGEEEPACDQQHNEPVRKVRARQPQQQHQSSCDAPPIVDQVRYMEELNRVAVQSGFRNAKEMLEMVNVGGTVLAMPPVAAYPPAPYHAPYDDGRSGNCPYPISLDPLRGLSASTSSAAPDPELAPNALVAAQPTSKCGSKKANVVLLANAVHAAQRFANEREGLSSILTSNQMRFFNVTGESEKLEVCHNPRRFGKFPSFFDSYKQGEAVGSDLIFRRIRPIDEVRFAKTITTLKKGRHAIWCGHPGIGKSTEANFVLLEFLRHLGDGEDSEWPTKVAHRVGGQLYLYTWNAATGRVECEMLPGETLLDVAKFSRSWNDLMYETEQKPPVLFLELDENEEDPKVSIPTFIALHSDDVKSVLKTIDKGGGCVYFLVRPHEPEEVLLMAKVMFEADPEQLCAHLECETEWDKAAKVLSNRMGIVGPLVRQVFSWQSAFDSYVKEMEAIATEVVTSPVLARLSVFNIPRALQYFIASFPLESADPMHHEFKYLSRHATSLLAKCLMSR